MSGNWTKGPWKVETVRTSCGTCHRIGPFPRPDYASKGEGWACVYDDYPPGTGSPDLLANARLIAAAPDLYAALESEIADLVIDIRWADDAELGRLIGRRDRIDAALAKARGEA